MRAIKVGLPPVGRNPIVEQTMSETTSSRSDLWLAVALAVGGVVIALGAWMLPVNLGALPPAVVTEAGAGTDTAVDLGREFLAREKPGPAALVLAAAEAVADEERAAFAEELRIEQARQPELVAWGGWDPFLDPLFSLRENRGRTESTPVLTFFITGRARSTLAAYLENSRSAGVLAMLRLRQIDRALQFVPATRAGGEALDAIVLLAALLYQGEHFSDTLQRELRGVAEAAAAAGDLTAIEPVFVDLLSLGQRLDWIQLTELTRVTDSVETLHEFAHLSRLAADDLAIIYAAAMSMESADDVAEYLIRYGHAGLVDLKFALGAGRGAVRQLLRRQVPINHEAGPSLGALASLGLRHPHIMLTLKYLGVLLGAFLVFRGLDRSLAARTTNGALPHMQSGALAVLLAALIIAATEPFLLRAAPPSEFKITFAIPVLADIADTSSAQPTPTTTSMDSSTLLSIGLFAALQVTMYLFCLLKIGEIDKQDLSPLVKLRLMENEENLFDGGLYVGIGGTATALVLQVLGLIEPNLLAAYSSNLFGITCVALVKIRHVRPYKRKLIMAGQAAIDAGVVVPAASR